MSIDSILKIRQVSLKEKKNLKMSENKSWEKNIKDLRMTLVRSLKTRKGYVHDLHNERRYQNL